MVKVLVTGVAGFMGSHVADHCVALGFDVVGIDDLSGGFIDNVPPRVTFVRGSVTDADLFESLEARYGRFDYIYHLAAYAAEGLSHFIRRFNYENNLLGSMNVLNYALNTKTQCVVFTSSIAVYGAGQLPMAEDTEPRPEDPYGIAKYAVELDLGAAKRMFGLDSIIFRPHNVYGERQNISDPYRNVIGIFMNQVMHGLPMSIFGDGSQTRAFSHIDDVAPVIAMAPTYPTAYNDIFNVGADTAYTVGDVARKVADAFGVPAKIEYFPARNEVQHAFSDHSKCRDIFGSSESVTLDDGIHRMADWVRSGGPRRPVAFGKVEVERNLPSKWRSI